MINNKEEEIIFDDPDEEIEQPLETLLEGDNPDQETPVVEIPDNRPRWSPSGALFNAEIVDDSPRFCQDGVMVDQLSNETTDPDSMNFLLQKQREHLQQDENGPQPVGGSFRAPDYDALQEVLDQELVCPFCQEPFTEADCDFHDLGQLVSYNGVIYHWACLGLWMLILAKGHPYRAAELFHVSQADMRALKSSYRAIPWGRLGYRQPGSEVNQ